MWKDEVVSKQTKRERRVLATVLVTIKERTRTRVRVRVRVRAGTELRVRYQLYHHQQRRNVGGPPYRIHQGFPQLPGLQGYIHT